MSFLKTVEGNIAKIGQNPQQQRDAALQSLKDRKARQNITSRAPTDIGNVGINGQPQQSRDGTVPTRYNSSQNSILVPSSSSPIPDPSSSSNVYTPHQSHFTSHVSQFRFQNSNMSSNGMYHDPLGSSSFKHAQKARPAPRDPADEPPRKKPNLGSKYDIVEAVTSPMSSPDVKMRPSKASTVLQSDDDASPLKTGSRIQRRPSPTGDSVPPLSLFLGVGGGTLPPPAEPTTLDGLFKKYPKVPRPLIQRFYTESAGVIPTVERKISNWSTTNNSSIAAQQAAYRAEQEKAKQRKSKSALHNRKPPNAVFMEYVPQSVAVTPKPKPKARVGSDDEEDFQGDGDDSDASDGMQKQDSELDILCTTEALQFFNETDAEQLILATACTPEQAKTIIRMRPFLSMEDVEGKMVRRTGVSVKLFENYKDLLKGYRTVDSVLARCEKIGEDIASVLDIWAKFSNQQPAKPPVEQDSEAAEDVGVHLTNLPTHVELANDPEKAKAFKSYIATPPTALASDLTLKSYQMLGLNWLNLLHSKGHSCILADEMGLGKTVQVIAFIAHLKDTQPGAKHLIIVPASTLENWVREFGRFAPTIETRHYYGSIPERADMRRDYLENPQWDVLLTTYNLAQGGEHDRKFFRKIEWTACVFDEGHVLKNFQSQRYNHLMRIEAKWRLLLTGTPLQNNLQELLSLMNFILPKIFHDVLDSFRAIFKVKATAQVSLLAHDRTSRAKSMMTPFVLRRRKDQVLTELPKKTERIEWCSLTDLQRTIYKEAMQRSRRVLMAEEEEDTLAVAEASMQKGRSKKKKKAPKTQAQDTSSNVLMDLRKATIHPMLYRRLYNDELVKKISKACLEEPEFAESNLQYVIEDMSVMTDAEIHLFCKRYKSIRGHALSETRHLESGKVEVLLKLLEQYQEEDRKILIFSQFVQVLDILKTILDYKEVKYLVLTGSTPVDERQGLVDEFNSDEKIKVFLLSTKAGGMGLNLTAASVVIIFDQDFNPHNDLQASDRAYRIGQQRDVDVVKLITRGTIEEDILQLAQTKLALDEAVAGDDEESGDKAEKQMKLNLMNRLRDQLADDNIDTKLLAATQGPLPPPAVLSTSTEPHVPTEHSLAPSPLGATPAQTPPPSSFATTPGPDSPNSDVVMLS